MSNDFDLSKLTGKIAAVVSHSDDDRKVELKEVSFATMQGAASIMFYNQQHEVAVAICPTPMIGLDQVIPNSLCYPIQIICITQLPVEELVQFVHSALDTINSDMLNEASLGNTGDTNQVLKVHIDREYRETHNGDSTSLVTYYGLVSREVKEEVIARNISVCQLQLKKYAELLTANKSTKH